MFRPRIRAKALSYRFGGNVTQPFRVDPGSADDELIHVPEVGRSNPADDRFTKSISVTESRES